MYLECVPCLHYLHKMPFVMFRWVLCDFKFHVYSAEVRIPALKMLERDVDNSSYTASNAPILARIAISPKLHGNSHSTLA